MAAGSKAVRGTRETATRQPLARQPAAREWSVGARGAASAVIAFHLFAVFIAPLSNPEPASSLAIATARRVEPYLQAVAINNGYRFFAPEPGPSHLVRYEVETADGTIHQGAFPDPKRHWPRLLYHRYFMLSEMVYSASPVLNDPPPEVLAEMTTEERSTFQDNQRRVLGLYRAIANDVASAQQDVVRVRLWSQEHLIPAPDDLRAGAQLSDSRLYREFSLAEFSEDEL